MKTLLSVLLMVCSVAGLAQQSTELTAHEASNPALVYTRFMMDVESYLFENGSEFYSIRPGGYYGLQNGRHQVGISVPFFHNVFNGDYGGYENTSGIGDIKMSYMFVPIATNDLSGFTTLSTYLEVTAPTGDELYGRGAGVWVYKPCAIATFRASHAVSFYPEVRYQFSANDANQSGSEDASDPEDPDDDGKVQNLILELPMVITVDSWKGWFALHTQFTHSYTEDTNFFYIRTDLGKMIGDRTSAALNIQKFIAGQPRLNLIVQVRLQFFLR
ncbi:MAG TPA: hypothetical protein VGK59_24215 [Ohtaekwangia sp.]